MRFFRNATGIYSPRRETARTALSMVTTWSLSSNNDINLIFWFDRNPKTDPDHSIFGRPFVKRFALCYRTVDLCLSVLSVLSECNIRDLWPNGWTDQDETCHAGRPRHWPHCVRW